MILLFKFAFIVLGIVCFLLVATPSSADVGGLMVTFGILTVVVSILVVLTFRFQGDLFDEDYKRFIKSMKDFHDRYLSSWTKRNLAQEKLQRDIFYWIERGNCMELKLLMKKFPEARSQILKRINALENYILGMRLAEDLKEKELLQDYHHRYYEQLLQKRQYANAIDFAKKNEDYLNAYQLTIQHFPETAPIQCGILAEKAGDFEAAIQYYQKENGLYEIAHLLIQLRDFERLFEFCKGQGHKKIALMVLEPLHKKGFPEEAERLKEKIIAYEKENSPSDA
jgi:tetratricopeptide (TPR) repeat protein